jgi:hypothetical protein
MTTWGHSDEILEDAKVELFSRIASVYAQDTTELVRTLGNRYRDESGIGVFRSFSCRY